MGYEGFGGCCPKCLKQMDQKYESSYSGFLFEACWFCGFIYVMDENDVTPKDIAEETWKDLFAHNGVTSREQLIEKEELQEYTSMSNKEFFPSIFSYKKDEGTHVMYKLLLKEAEDKAFSLSGLKVVWNEDGEDKGKEGTLMGYKEGKVYILWEEHVGSKLPCFDYPAIEVGETIKLTDEII